MVAIMLIRTKTMSPVVCCPRCEDAMRLVRTIPKLGALPDLRVYLCERCSYVETVEAERAA
jgi:hypothetical protein